MASAVKAQGGRVQQVDAATAQAWLAADEAVLVDVREPGEVRAQPVDGALVHPTSRFDPAAVAVPAGKKVVVLCASGFRADQCAGRLAALGQHEVYCLRNGLKGWQQPEQPQAATVGSTAPATGATCGPLPLQRQVQLVVGPLTILGVLLAALVSPWWLILPGFIGCGLTVAGATGRCALADALARAPWNQ